jgi:polar amino acid transport system permease protein
VLVQLIFWFNLGIIFPHIRLGIPFTDITFWSEPTNNAIRPMTAAILGLGLNEGAYVAEIVRAGIISVGKGQTDAAAALGMRRAAVMRRVVLPQAVPVVIPPMGNEFIGMLKYSALASVIAVEELLGSVERIYSTNLRTLELLVVASIWYLACTTALTIGQHYLERYVGRSRATPQAEARRRIWNLRRTAH